VVYRKAGVDLTFREQRVNTFGPNPVPLELRSSCDEPLHASISDPTEEPKPPSEAKKATHRPQTARARSIKPTGGGGKRRPATARGRKERGSDYSTPHDVGPNADNVVPPATRRLKAGSRFTIRSGKKDKSEVWQTGSDGMMGAGRWPQNRTSGTGLSILSMGRSSMWDKKLEHTGPGQYDIGKALDATRSSTGSFYIKEKRDTKPLEDEKSGQLNTHELQVRTSLWPLPSPPCPWHHAPGALLFSLPGLLVGCWFADTGRVLAAFWSR